MKLCSVSSDHLCMAGMCVACLTSTVHCGLFGLPTHAQTQRMEYVECCHPSAVCLPTEMPHRRPEGLCFKHQKTRKGKAKFNDNVVALRFFAWLHPFPECCYTSERVHMLPLMCCSRRIGRLQLTIFTTVQYSAPMTLESVRAQTQTQDKHTTLRRKCYRANIPRPTLHRTRSGLSWSTWEEDAECNQHLIHPYRRNTPMPKPSSSSG